jgi:hypothetical protein
MENHWMLNLAVRKATARLWKVKPYANTPQKTRTLQPTAIRQKDFQQITSVSHYTELAGYIFNAHPMNFLTGIKCIYKLQVIYCKADGEQTKIYADFLVEPFKVHFTPIL